MKRVIPILLSAAMMLQLAACGSPNSSSSIPGAVSSAPNVSSAVSSEGSSPGVGAEKGLFDVSVTFPAEMFEGTDFETIKKQAEDQGIKSITQNDDGSVTYKMSKADHKKMMEDMKTSTAETLKGYVTDTDLESITDVSFNDDFSEIKISVDKEKYENSLDSFAALGAGFQGMFYQMFDGRKEEEVSVKVDFVDNKTGKVLDSAIYPDAFNDSSSK